MSTEGIKEKKMARKQFVQNDNNFAITYSRFSSHSQNEASIAQQQELNNKYAEAHGYTVIKEYADYAMSGQNEDRPQYQLMLSEVKKIKPAVLIMWKNDRLGRDVLELQYAKRKIREAGCKIELVSEMAPDVETSQGKLIENVMDSFAQFWSDTSRENIRRGQKSKASQAKFLGHKVFGYTVDEDDNYVIDPETEPIVVRIFNDYANGKPMAQIARELNEQGIRSAIGNKFTVNGLRSILKNDRYIGVYKYGEYIIEDGMPVIIDEALFNRVQSQFDKNKRMKHKNVETHRHWLSGKLYCGHCGSAMQGTSGTSKTSKIYYYYECAKARKRKCNKKRIPAYDIEEIVKNLLADILNNSENIASMAVDAHFYYKEYHTENKYLESLEAELRNTKKILRNLLKAIEAGIISETTQLALTEREEQKRALEEAIEVEKIKRSITKDKHSIEAYFQKFSCSSLENTEVRDSVLNYFIDKIYVYDDKIVLIGNYDKDERELTFEDYEEVMLTGGRGFDLLMSSSTKSKWVTEKF